MATLLAASGAVVPVPPVAAQPLPSTPRIFVTPPCVPVPIPGIAVVATDVTVSGRNHTPGRVLELEFRPGSDDPNQPLGSVTVGPYGSFDQGVSVVLPSRFGPFRIVAFDRGAEFFVETALDVPCRPKVVVTPACSAPDDGTGQVVTIQVDGTDWGPGLPVTVSLIGPDPDGERTYAGPEETSPGEDGRFGVTLTAKGLFPALYHVRVSQPRIKEEQNIEFRVPCLTPAMTAEPVCAPAGQPPGRDQIELSGTGFIPNRGIYFEYDPGPNSQDFEYNVDIPEGGAWGPVHIEPYQRPPGTYALFARQYNGPYTALEVRIDFGIPCPEPAVTLDPPDCGPPQFVGQEQQRYELVVRGTDFREGPLTITFDADSTDTTYPAETFAATADAEGSFAQAIDPLRRPAGTYRIEVEQVRPELRTIRVDLTFRAPCIPPRPAFARTPVCGPELPGVADAYTIGIRLSGYIPGPVELIFDADGTPETEIATVAENGRLTFDLTPSGRAAGEYRILAIQRDPKQTLAESSRSFTVPCPTEKVPTLRIEPTNAAPGFVTVVDGTGFPANATVTLRWDRGIRKDYTVQCDADGAFKLQVLILVHDFSGPREMTAGTPEDPAAFPDARDGLLVVAGIDTPRGIVLAPSFRFTPGLPIVFR